MRIDRCPRPDPAGMTRVRAFGLNRSELFTRRGQSPNVRFPRILGIEAVGEVVEAPAGGFAPGDKVATAMGGMVRAFDGGYAEYTLVPASQVQKIETGLDWPTLGARSRWCTDGVFTAYGPSAASGALLIRGGTTSVGLTAAILAKKLGATVIATTRKSERETMLKANGADHVVIDDGQIADTVRGLSATGVDRVLELIGTTTLLDSLIAAGRSGVVCMTEWSAIAGSLSASVLWAPFLPPSASRQLCRRGGGLHGDPTSGLR